MLLARRIMAERACSLSFALILVYFCVVVFCQLWFIIFVIKLCALDDSSCQLQVRHVVDGAAAAERRSCSAARSSAGLHGGMNLFLVFRFLFCIIYLDLACSTFSCKL